MAVLGADRHGAEAGALQRRRRRGARREFGLALAEQRDRHMGEGREIGGADRADRGHDRVEAGVERVGERLRHHQRHPGLADAHAGDAGRHHGAHLLGRHLPAHTDCAGEGDAALEGGKIVGRQTGVDAGAETGGEAIDRLVVGDRLSITAREAAIRSCAAFERVTGRRSRAIGGDVVDAEAMIAETTVPLSHGALLQRLRP